MKKTIKNITIIKLIQIFVLAILIITTVIALAYRAFFQNIIESQAVTIASSVKAGLTSHMKADIMDKKHYFLNEITKIEDLEYVKIINTTKNDFEKSENILKAIETKTHHFDWNDIDGKFQAVTPYIANSEGTLNCLSCHDAQNGDVLGVIVTQMDISSAQKLVLNYGYFLLALFIFFAVLILANLSKLIERYISGPLLNVIDEGEKAYYTHTTLDSNQYESQELEKVALNINHFNEDVIAKENEIYKKNFELQKLNDEIESTLKETMMAMGEIEEIRSEETKNHTARVSKLSALIAKEYGLSESDIKLIELASPLHDIGKVGIGDSILQKPGRLTDEEFEIMKGHAALGYKVLKHSKRRTLQAAAEIAHSHHEKWNGLGYPQGLKGEEIPVFARIVAIIDVMDALLCKRIYKDSWTEEEVKQLLLKERGEHFEAKLVDIVLDNFDAYVKIIRNLAS